MHAVLVVLIAHILVINQSLATEAIHTHTDTICLLHVLRLKNRNSLILNNNVARASLRYHLAQPVSIDKIHPS